MFAALLAMASLLSVVSYRFPASSANAVFSAHAVLARVTADVISSEASASDFSMLDCRTPDRPISSRTRVALSPCSSSRPRPAINAWSAETASVSQVEANSDAETPAIRAN